MRSLWLAAACALLSSCSARSEFRLLETDDEGRLEVAWHHFRAPAGRPPVLLVNMLHVGSPEFFAEVQSELDRSSVVLMEGVKSGRRGPPSDSAEDADRPLARIEAAYSKLAAELAMASQSHSLNPAPHWRFPDFTEDEIERSFDLNAAATALRQGVERIAAAAAMETALLHARRPDIGVDEAAAFVRTGPLRRALAEGLVDSDGREDAVVIVARNEAALRELFALRDVSGRVAVCYGAAHSSHLRRRLMESGYEVESIERRVVFRFARRLPRAIPRRGRSAA